MTLFSAAPNTNPHGIPEKVYAQSADDWFDELGFNRKNILGIELQ